MINPTIVRLEVEGMKHAILAALNTHAAGIQAEVEVRVAEFDWQASVRRQIGPAIDRAIATALDDYFRGYGRDLIARAVKDAITVQDSTHAG